jgi:hypothetical protein
MRPSSPLLTLLNPPNPSSPSSATSPILPLLALPTASLTCSPLPNLLSSLLHPPTLLTLPHPLSPLLTFIGFILSHSYSNQFHSYLLLTALLKFKRSLYLQYCPFTRTFPLKPILFLLKVIHRSKHMYELKHFGMVLFGFSGQSFPAHIVPTPAPIPMPSSY